MMIRISEISVIEEPHIPVISYLVILSHKELCEVLRRFYQVAEPYQSREI